jgi:hypothetical protein
LQSWQEEQCTRETGARNSSKSSLQAPSLGQEPIDTLHLSRDVEWHWLLAAKSGVEVVEDAAQLVDRRAGELADAVTEVATRRLDDRNASAALTAAEVACNSDPEILFHPRHDLGDTKVENNGEHRQLDESINDDLLAVAYRAPD